MNEDRKNKESGKTDSWCNRLASMADDPSGDHNPVSYDPLSGPYDIY